MARVVEISEPERRSLLALLKDEWSRLDKIRHGRVLFNDPILEEQQAVEGLQAKLR